MSNNLEKTKQRKFKSKYQIFAKELDGISLNNWKSNILSDMTDGDGFRQLDELIHSINEGGNSIMTANVEEIIKLVCPLCERALANEEYHKAIQKLESQAKEKYEKEKEIMRKTHNKELEDMRVQTEQNVKQYYDELLHNKEKEKEDQRNMFEQFKENYENAIDKQYKDKFSRLTDIITEKETQMKRAERGIRNSKKKTYKKSIRTYR